MHLGRAWQGVNNNVILIFSPLRTERSNIRTARRKTPSGDSQRKVDYENRKQNDNVNVNPGISVHPKSITSVKYCISMWTIGKITLTWIYLSIWCQCGRLEACQIIQKYHESVIVFLNTFVCCHLNIQI